MNKLIALLTVALVVLSACGGGGGSSSTTSEDVTEVPAAPAISATLGSTEITLTWFDVATSNSYTLYYAEQSIDGDIDNISTYTNGTSVPNINGSPYVVTGLSNATTYYFTLTAVNDGGESAVSNEVSITPLYPKPFNDTGITACGDHAYNGGSGNHSNSEDCAASTDSDGDPIPAGQDGHYGRDVTHNDDSDGHAGFSFTKLDTNGDAVANDAIEWDCVKDNVTGLTWEVKQTAAGGQPRDANNTYTWYNTDSNNNGGIAGIDDEGSCTAGGCDTEGFVATVNTATLCGANDWRMPTREELRGIVDYSTTNPAIDTAWFPNTNNNVYWSASPNASSSTVAWVLSFGNGSGYSDDKSVTYSVRLVRGQ